MLRLLAVLLLAAVVSPLTLSSVSAAPYSPITNRTSARIIELINARRAQAGLRAVTPNAVLEREAQRFSAVQASMGRLSHRGVDGTTAGQRLTRAGYRWSFFGENLAAGQQTADRVVVAWMASPGHRANIMNPRAREIGVGHTYRPDDPNRYFDYWVIELARSR